MNQQTDFGRAGTGKYNAIHTFTSIHPGRQNRMKYRMYNKYGGQIMIAVVKKNNRCGLTSNRCDIRSYRCDGWLSFEMCLQISFRGVRPVAKGH